MHVGVFDGKNNMLVSNGCCAELGLTVVACTSYVPDYNLFHSIQLINKVFCLLIAFPVNLETNEKHFFAKVVIAAIDLMMIDDPATE